MDVTIPSSAERPTLVRWSSLHTRLEGSTSRAGPESDGHVQRARLDAASEPVIHSDDRIFVRIPRPPYCGMEIVLFIPHYIIVVLIDLQINTRRRAEFGKDYMIMVERWAWHAKTQQA